MDGALSVSIATPEKPLAMVYATLVEAPGSFGQLGIMPGHASIVTELQAGLLKIITNDNEEALHYYVSGGFLEIQDNCATILVDVLEASNEVDRERANKAEKRAIERLAAISDKDINIPRALGSLSRARARLALFQKLQSQKP